MIADEDAAAAVEIVDDAEGAMKREPEVDTSAKRILIHSFDVARWKRSLVEAEAAAEASMLTKTDKLRTMH